MKSTQLLALVAAYHNPIEIERTMGKLRNGKLDDQGIEAAKGKIVVEFHFSRVADKAVESP